jgi:hypothetical protein
MLVGPNAVRARLLGQGVHVQRWRVRNSVQRINPDGCVLRSCSSIARRTYTVAGPNSLWHIDGNHKLIRYRIVIHGGIDGCTRLLVFLTASDNNRKETVLRSFLAASAMYGLPSRIRVDKGGENNDVRDVMEVLRGSNRGSVIRGKSVHNQRIERAWVDVWKGVTNVYVDIFEFLAARHLLSSDDDNHLWALHYVYLPRINRDLLLFCNQWNNHGLRTEHHQSPLQLFVSKSLQLRHSNLTAMQDLFTAPTSGYRGVPVAASDAGTDDINAMLSNSWADDEQVVVPAIQCSLSEERLNLIRTRINPLDDSLGPMGLELYAILLNIMAE